MFRGTSCPEEAEIWLKNVSDQLRLLQVPEELRVEVVASFLEGEAEQWWHNVQILRTAPVMWTQFREEFHKFYIPDSVIQKRMTEFQTLTQGSMTVARYTERFHALGRYMPSIMENERAKMLKYRIGLNSHIQTGIVYARPRTYEDLLEVCREVQDDFERVAAEEKNKRHREETSEIRPERRIKVPKISQEDQPQQQQPKVNPQNGIPNCPTCNRPHTGVCWKRSGACFNCGKIGHLNKDCPEPRRLQKGPK